MIKFAYTILYVQDVVKTVIFYETAFGFERKFISPDNTYGELKTGETTLSFAAVSLGKLNLTNGFTESSREGKPFGIEIGFTTKDVTQAINKAIDAGATLLEPSKIKPWGQEVAYVRDPDGFLIEICTPMD